MSRRAPRSYRRISQPCRHAPTPCCCCARRSCTPIVYFFNFLTSCPQVLQKHLAKGECEFRVAEGAKPLVLLLLPDKIKLREGSRTLLKESYASGGDLAAISP